MTNDQIEHQLTLLTQIATTALESIQGLERIAAQHTQQIGQHTEQIGRLLENAERQEREMQQLIREWQAYLRTVHPRQ
jgi:hypothetical protein